MSERAGETDHIWWAVGPNAAELWNRCVNCRADEGSFKGRQPCPNACIAPSPEVEIDALNLPLDERTYAALVEALGMDEDDAQAALDAALPALREAWDSGYFTGAIDEREDPGGKAKSPNPYRVLRPGQVTP